MSRFSPQVLPDGPRDEFGDFASSVAGALEQRRSRKRQQLEDTIAAEDRTRRIGREDRQDARQQKLDAHQELANAITLYQSGYRQGDPPPGGDGLQGPAAMGAPQRGNQLPGQPAYQAPPEAPHVNQRGNFTQGEYGGASSEIAGMLEARRSRGNMTPGGMAGPVAAPPAAAQTPAPPEYGGGVAGMLDQRRLGNSTAGGDGGSPAVPAPGQKLPATPGGMPAGPGGPAAPLSPMQRLGGQFYSLPGGQGYLDLTATPEARTARQQEQDDLREHGQATELEGVRSRYRGQEAAAEHGYDAAESAAGDQRKRDLEIEVERMGNRSAERIEGMRGSRETATERKSARTTATEDAQGLALMNSILAQPGGKPANPALAAAFAPIFRAMRTSYPDWHPGRVSFQAYKALKDSRPDLFPPKQKASGETTDPARRLAEIKARLRPGTGTGAAAPAPTAGASPAETSALSPLDDDEKGLAASDPEFRRFLLEEKGYAEADLE